MLGTYFQRDVTGSALGRHSARLRPDKAGFQDFISRQRGKKWRAPTHCGEKSKRDLISGLFSASPKFRRARSDEDSHRIDGSLARRTGYAPAGATWPFFAVSQTDLNAAIMRTLRGAARGCRNVGLDGSKLAAKTMSLAGGLFPLRRYVRFGKGWSGG